MNLSNFFSLFSNNDKDKNQQEEDSLYQTTLADIMNTPAYWVGMFKKLIYNYKSHGNKLLMQVEGFDIGANYDDVQSAYEFMLYERSYFYLTCLDINNPGDLEILKKSQTKSYYLHLIIAFHITKIKKSMKSALILKKFRIFLKTSAKKLDSPRYFS